jgi:HD-GYP domain-containing protein (c-di-GMP phosphodiesterase class II)
MTAVADTYHALVSDRPYRRGMSPEKAMEVIEEVCGTQLCPECVAVFKGLPRNLLESFI